MQVDVGVGGMKVGQAGNQPFHRDGRLAGQHQHILTGLLLEAVDRALQLFEDRQGGAMQGTTGRGEKHGAVAALEQRHPQ
ncbi:hypothetical protein D3C77_726960 [compost metagenome]